MIELGKTAAPAAPAVTGDLIKDVTEATFMVDVVEASQTIPVIVDFWAPWCGPCKTLGPALEAAVTAAGGRVKMVKIDVDQCQQIAAQLRIQSIPTVYAFWQGQPVDGFQGAVPASELKAFVEKAAALAGEPDNGLADAVEAAEDMLEAGEVADAMQTFSAILEEDPLSAESFSGLIRGYLALGEVEEAEAALNGVPAEIALKPVIEAARAQLELAKQAANAGPEAELRTAVDAAPDDSQLRFDLALALHANGKIEESVAELLELFRRDRDWNDGAAKAQLFKIFDALKPQDPIALKGRRKLSSMLFV